MKVALVHEWFSKVAGSEKVVKELHSIWPNADIFSLVDFLSESDRKYLLDGARVHTSFIQSLPWARKHFRKYLLWFPIAIEQFDLSGYDLIISSSHAVAKGVITNADQTHICYCHTPMRYAWDLYHQYLKEANLTRGIKSIFAKWMLHYLRIWDYQTAQRVDYFIANSRFISQRIKKVYQRNALVIHPPVDVDGFELEEDKEDFYLAASRAVPYKRLDLIIETFKQLPDKKLIVVGDGKDLKKLSKQATENIEVKGYLPIEQLKIYMQKAKALVFAAEEDFGIIPVEAQACGTPVIAYGKGGSLETVVADKTGIFFEEQTIQSLTAAITLFEKQANGFDPKSIRAHAQQFSSSRFKVDIENAVLGFINKQPDS